MTLNAQTTTRQLHLFAELDDGPFPVPLKAFPSPSASDTLETVRRLDQDLAQHFPKVVSIEPALNRQVVSFQANKRSPAYRWFKYKEAFSVSLVEYLLRRFAVTGRLLDPFAGMGTSLFAASAAGLSADGIELLPIGQAIVNARLLAQNENSQANRDSLRRWLEERPWRRSEQRVNLPELRITKGAYPPDTHDSIERYLAASKNEPPWLRTILRFALLCVLESISYTRKDGQYLRWDHRAGRRQGAKTFDKGTLPSFDQAITSKLNDVVADMDWFANTSGLLPSDSLSGTVQLLDGSCLDLLPQVPHGTYDLILTSPPYCNRYDYTRTYALELALLGMQETDVLRLRQEMLSCTVENRAKDLLALNPAWAHPISIAHQEELLQSILKHLDDQRDRGLLNNSGIPRMVRGYFYEMACVVFECARVMKPGARFFMVNDNVRYAGASVSVDMILSHFAEQMGLHVDAILVLPNGKGNSSQQMGEHGREPLRKCVYVWSKR